MNTDGKLWAIVLAGGNGSRLRSTLGHDLPKQFCAFRGDHSLLQLTMYRILPLVPPRRCVVVVASEHRPTAERQTGRFRGVEIIDQPLDRGTAAGVLLPLTHILETEPDARILLLPSDHAFADEGLFVRGIDEVDRAVERQLASVVLFGAAADRPHGDYGWIIAGRPLDGPKGRLRRVIGFREKPGEDAWRLLETGALWNTMVLLARGRILRALFTRHLPDLVPVFRGYAMLPKEDRAAFLADEYPNLRSADFSRDLVARAEGLAVYAWPGDVGWTDLGTPQRLRGWLHNQERGGAHDRDPEIERQEVA